MSRPLPRRQTPIVLAAIMVLAAVPGLVAADDSAEPAGNIAVRVIVRASETPAGDPSSREYRVTLVPGEPANVVHGRRLPIPTTSFDTSRAGGGGLVPVTSYSYQTVGFHANLEATLLSDGRIRIDGSIVDSHVRQRGNGNAIYQDGGPEIDAVEQWVHVYVRPGETVMLHRSDSGDRKVEIRLQADLTG